MLKEISWKNYILFILLVIVVTFLINWKIGTGILLGTLCYFINLFLAEKKFPSLDVKIAAIGGALAVIALEGFITAGMAIGTWFIGKLPCFVSGFAAMIVPNIYFFIFGLKK